MSITGEELGSVAADTCYVNDAGNLTTDDPVAWTKLVAWQREYKEKLIFEVSECSKLLMFSVASINN